jgi:hypothetical protein
MSTGLVEGICSSANPPITSAGFQKALRLTDTIACKNYGTCDFTHCFRADGIYQNLSIIANMTQVVTTISFDNTGTWTANVQTSAFTAAEATVSSSRSANVSAKIGACGSPATRRLLYAVGSSVNICVSTTDKDVVLTLKDVKANPGNQTLVNSLSQPNFVTSVSNSGTSAVDLETLMIPTYYDLQGGSEGSVVIEGTAELTYSRRLTESIIALGGVKEDTDFSIDIPLVPNVGPEITDFGEAIEGSSACGLGSATTALSAVVAGILYCI